MKRYLFLSTILTSLMFIASCGGNVETNSATNSSTNTNANVPEHGQVANRDSEPTENNAPTIAPVVQQFYDALKNKDDEKLKETLTTEFQKTIEEDMKSEGKKSIAEFVAETNYRPGQQIEVRNEKINGNKGVAELRGGAYKNWTAFEFALENGKWRFTGGSPEIENMPKANINAAH